MKNTNDNNNKLSGADGKDAQQTSEYMDMTGTSTTFARRRTMAETQANGITPATGLSHGLQDRSRSSLDTQHYQRESTFISRDELTKLEERDDLDDLDGDETMTESPDVRQKKNKSSINAMSDNNVGAQTLKVEKEANSGNKFHSLQIEATEPNMQTFSASPNFKGDPDAPPNESRFARSFLDHNQNNNQNNYRTNPAHDQGAEETEKYYEDGLRQNYGVMSVKDYKSSKTSPGISPGITIESNTIMVNKTQDTSKYASQQHTRNSSVKNGSKVRRFEVEESPDRDLKSEQPSPQIGSSRLTGDQMKQMKFENEKLKTSLEFLMQGGDVNELIHIFGKDDPQLRDLFESRLNEESNQMQQMQEASEPSRGMRQYSEQDMHLQNRSVERVQTYNQLNQMQQRQHVTFAAHPSDDYSSSPPAEDYTPADLAAPYHPSQQYQQQQMPRQMGRPSAGGRPSNMHLAKSDKKQLISMNKKMNNFAQKEAKKNIPELHYALKANKQVHNNLMGEPHFRKKFQHQAPADEDEQSDDQSSSKSDETMESFHVEERKFALNRHDNPYVKMIKSNVEKACKYNPARQDRPIFRFFGSYYAGSPQKGQKAKVQSRAGSIDQTRQSLGDAMAQDGRMEDASGFDHGRHSMPLTHPDGRPISVPVKFMTDPRNQEEHEIEAAAQRKLLERLSQRTRGLPRFYDYDFTTLNERHVDKFRLATKNAQERNATDLFVRRYNDEFANQKEIEQAGGKVPDQKKINAEMSVNQMEDIVKDYSTYDFDRAEENKAHVIEMRTAAREASRWAIIGANNPGAPRSRQRAAQVELYGEFAIDLGINNAADTELNTSPEGKLRRKALHDKEQAKKKFADFKRTKDDAKNTGLNLTLKRMDI